MCSRGLWALCWSERESKMIRRLSQISCIYRRRDSATIMPSALSPHIWQDVLCRPKPDAQPDLALSRAHGTLLQTSRREIGRKWSAGCVGYGGGETS